MNILAFNYEYPPLGGGGGIVHEAVAEELAREHRVCMITSAYRDLPPHEEKGGVEIHRVPVLGRDAEPVATLPSMLSYPPAAWLRAASLLRAQTFDIIDSYFAVPTGPASICVARAARIPHVLTIIGGDLYDPSKKLSPHRISLLRSTVGGIIRASDAVVAPSQNTIDNARHWYGFKRPIELIPLGIVQPDVAPVTRDELGLPDGYLAISVGRLVRRKALDVLLEALAQPSVSDVRLALIGNGPELHHLHARAAELNVSHRVHFLGEVEETRKLQMLRAADVYVSSSMHEGFGLVYLEAMAAGLPIVTTGNGGHTDFLVEGQNAFLTPVADAAALAESIAKLRRNPEAARRMRATNLVTARRFQVPRFARMYEELFARVVAENARATERSVLPARVTRQA